MEVHTHYQGLLESFILCGKASGYKTKGNPQVRLQRLDPPHGVWSQLDLIGGHLSLTTDIARGNINGFAEDLGINTGEMEILVHPWEKIRRNDPWDIKESKVEVAYVYYDLEADKTHLLLALHFDFSVKDNTAEPSAAHPIFHVSPTDKLFRLRGVLQQRGAVLDRMSGMPNLRLPTAHMTFPSVLMNIAADRFLPEKFADFLGSIREAGLDYPKMDNNPFRQRMNAQQNRMRSCAWYAA